jgi:hypothetical protein
LIIIVIAQNAGAVSAGGFERAVRGVLGPNANLQVRYVDQDPADEETEALGNDADGVVELTWSEDDARAKIHCYVARQQRWVDREIVFRSNGPSPEREAAERARLLGFAVATLLGVESPPAKPEPVPSAKPPPRVPARRSVEPRRGATPPTPRRSLEFGGIASVGMAGPASGFGASAAVRLVLARPLWLRVFVAGRAGDVDAAQVSTRTVELGVGPSVALLPRSTPWELGLRADVMLSYFGAAYLAANSLVPEHRSRWLGGCDFLGEIGFRFAGNTGMFVAGGVEAVLGPTDIYARGVRMAVVPAFRGVGELGLRTAF